MLAEHAVGQNSTRFRVAVALILALSAGTILAAPARADNTTPPPTTGTACSPGVCVTPGIWLITN